MAVAELLFTVPGKSHGDVLLTYDPAAVSANGSVVATAASGSYNTLDAAGNVVHTDTVTGIVGPGELLSGDNLINFGGRLPLLTLNGVEFTIDNVADADYGNGRVKIGSEVLGGYSEAGKGDAIHVSITPVAGSGATSDNQFFAVNGIGGADAIVGGGSTNFVGVQNAAGTGQVLVNLKEGYVSKGGHVDATLRNIQGVNVGSDPSVVVGLASGVDLIYGGTGAMTVQGQGATDYIQGGTATNTIIGGAGNEIFFGNGGTDVMRGGSAANFMAGGTTASSSSTFYGTTGSDYVYGHGGSVTLVGGTGTELLSGGSGFNQLVGTQAGTAQTVGISVLVGTTGTDVFYGGVGTNLMYEGAGTDVFSSTSGTDLIYGNTGKSFVYGGSGTTVVTTGAANQFVQAGSGQTVFNDVAANQTAGRFDQIDNFSGGKATDVYMATAAQGNTTFVAQNGGTAIVTAVAGGTATLFASGTDVATAQAHTHFTL